jgi:hypothetical protein
MVEIRRLVPEDVVKTAEYVFKKYMESPMIQRFLQLEAAFIAAAADARLAAGMAHLRNSTLLIGSAELALTLGVPVATWIGVFAAMGAPYLEAKAVVTHEKFQSGFSQGFVCGILKWEWSHATSRFGKYSAGPANPFDATLSVMAANSYNDGLKAGFTHANLLKEDARKALLYRLKSLSPHSSPGNWDRRDQVAYVVELAAAGRRHQVFRRD